MTRFGGAMGRYLRAQLHAASARSRSDCRSRIPARGCSSTRSGSTIWSSACGWRCAPA